MSLRILDPGDGCHSFCEKYLCWIDNRNFAAAYIFYRFFAFSTLFNASWTIWERFIREKWIVKSDQCFWLSCHCVVNSPPFFSSRTSYYFVPLSSPPYLSFHLLVPIAFLPYHFRYRRVPIPVFESELGDGKFTCFLSFFDRTVGLSE